MPMKTIYILFRRKLMKLKWMGRIHIQQDSRQQPEIIRVQRKAMFQPEILR